MSTLYGLLIAVVIVGVASCFIIWVVGKLKIGLDVDGFVSAFIVAIVIAVVAGVTTLIVNFWVLQDGQGLVGGIVHLIISAIVLPLSARLLPGVKVTRFIGVMVAAIAIGAFYWLGGLALGTVIS